MIVDFSGTQRVFEVLGILLGCGFCCGLFGLNLLCAALAGHIAQMRRGEFYRHFVLSLFIGPLAVLLALLLDKTPPAELSPESQPPRMEPAEEKEGEESADRHRSAGI
jgi:hypothetical protein